MGLRLRLTQDGIAVLRDVVENKTDGAGGVFIPDIRALMRKLGLAAGEGRKKHQRCKGVNKTFHDSIELRLVIVFNRDIAAGVVRVELEPDLGKDERELARSAVGITGKAIGPIDCRLAGDCIHP